MVLIGKKSFIGFLIGVLLIFVGITIKEKFQLTLVNSILIVWVSFFIIYIVGYVILNGYFNNKNDRKNLDRLIRKLEKISDPTEIQKIIIQKSKKNEFRLEDIRRLMYHFKLDDEFWIEFFNTNNFTLTNTNYDGIDLKRILESLNSVESRTELLDILVRKGIINQGEFRV